ncbi:MAG: glycosyltransferase involved in cell wall biosynthesis [Candidatus Nitrosomirales archaeon]|jgi:glycosyltransferase involved in cell wall biosynthesis
METFETSTDRENHKRRSPKVFACIPAYNQEKSIERVVRTSLKYVERVIVIDDGSFDRTAELAEQAGAIVIRHAMNMGYGAAIKSGFRIALKERADIIVTLDADMQHNPEDIPSLLAPIVDGNAEIVIGSRIIENNNEMPAYRKAGVRFITKLMQYNGVSVKDAQSGFRAYSLKALQAILPNLTDSGYGLITESLTEASRYKLPIVEVPVVIRYDTGMPTSKRHPFSHGAGVVYSIVYYVAERRPLLTLGLPGIVSLALGMWWLVTVLDIFNRTNQFAIGTGIFSIGAIVLGVLLMVVSVILTVLSRLSRSINYRAGEADW